METNRTLFAGFFSSSSITFMHLQDILVAVILGFFGAAGAYAFKLLVDRLRKK